MRHLAIALLATTMISSAAFAADSKPPQTAQHQMQSDQQAQKPETQHADNTNQQARNESQSISVKTLSRREIREIQQALNKNGDKVGPTDGRWGPKTEDALKQFERAKNMPANGELDRQAVASLGLNSSEFSQAPAK